MKIPEISLNKAVVLKVAMTGHKKGALFVSALLFWVALANFCHRAFRYGSVVGLARQMQKQTAVWMKQQEFSYLSSWPKMVNATNPSGSPRDRRLQAVFPDRDHNRVRVLYMVTSLSANDTGYRATTEGYDRYGTTLVPVVSESVHSMVSADYDVAVYLIAHYEVTIQHYRLLKGSFPPNVPLYVWSNATPYGYEPFDNQNYLVMKPKQPGKGGRRIPSQVIEPVTRALARQHRFVIKDLLTHYDLFVAFEDDMLIHGAHIQHYHNLTNQLYKLRSKAPRTLPKIHATSNDKEEPLFYGPMTQSTLKRMLPGFIRVEVVPSPDWVSPRRREDAPGHLMGDNKVPIDYLWNRTSPERIDPSICCHRSSLQAHQQPSVEQLRFWETSINALHVRQMPDQSWVLLQAGNNESIYRDPNRGIGRFWTGENYEEEYFGEIPIKTRRPKLNDGNKINNQGGWMATRRQILEWHTERCFGGFLPPYNPSDWWQNDGIAKGTVEFWSGGLQLVGVLSCNLQRIIPLDPDAFRASLLYHTSNNKQNQWGVQKRFVPNNIQEFWGQLNTVRKNAQKQKELEIAELKAMISRQSST